MVDEKKVEDLLRDAVSDAASDERALTADAAAAGAPTSQENRAEEVGLPERMLDSTSAPPMTKGLQQDVARILEEAKLPERKEFRAAADAPPGDAPSAHPPPLAPLETPPTKPPTALGKEGIAAVHTLKDDLQTAVHDKNLSLVEAAALEQNKRAHAARAALDEFPHPRARVFKTLLISGLLVLIGVLALGAIIMIIRDRSGLTSQSAFIVKGLIFAEQTIPFPIQGRSGVELKRLFAEARNSSNTSLGVITRVAPLTEVVDPETNTASERLATTREFFDVVGFRAPDELLRALGDEFFFGFHTVDENAPVLVIPVTSYERAFAGLLAWEKSMNADLSPVFTRVPPFARTPDGILVERAFEDGVMRNFDVRALKDDAGVVQLYYALPTRELLIIAESPYSFAEILARLRAERRL